MTIFLFASFFFSCLSPSLALQCLVLKELCLLEKSRRCLEREFGDCADLSTVKKAKIFKIPKVQAKWGSDLRVNLTLSCYMLQELSSTLKSSRKSEEKERISENSVALTRS